MGTPLSVVRQFRFSWRIADSSWPDALKSWPVAPPLFALGHSRHAPPSRYSLIIYLLDRVFLRPYNFEVSKRLLLPRPLRIHLLALMQILRGGSSSSSKEKAWFGQSPSNHATLIHFRFNLRGGLHSNAIHVTLLSSISPRGLFFQRQITPVTRSRRWINVWLIADLIHPSFVSTVRRFRFRFSRPVGRRIRPPSSVSNRLFFEPPPSYRFQGTLRIPLPVCFPSPSLGRWSLLAAESTLRERETFRGRNLRNARTLKGVKGKVSSRLRYD